LVRATDAAGNAATATQTLRLLSRTCNVQVGATIVRQGQSLGVEGVCSNWQNIGKIEFYVDGVLQSAAVSPP